MRITNRDVIVIIRVWGVGWEGLGSIHVVAVWRWAYDFSDLEGYQSDPWPHWRGFTSQWPCKPHRKQVANTTDRLGELFFGSRTRYNPLP